MNHLVYVKKPERIPLEHLTPTDVFVLQTGGAHTSHLSTKRLEVVQAASNNISAMQSDLPSRGQKELRK